MSPLTQGRELKLAGYDWKGGETVSPLTQGRELKLNPVLDILQSVKVAPHAGA